MRDSVVRGGRGRRWRSGIVFCRVCRNGNFLADLQFSGIGDFVGFEQFLVFDGVDFGHRIQGFPFLQDMNSFLSRDGKAE